MLNASSSPSNNSSLNTNNKPNVMKRASKWFRGLLGFKKPDPVAEPGHNKPSSPKNKKKCKWSFPKGKHRRRKSQNAVTVGVSGNGNGDETTRKAIAVAAATAAVAEAAVAAAHAAAAVAQLTSGGGFDRAATYTAAFGGGGSNAVVYGNREERAAVVIQSHFRAYLSKRALRALRALVKLQALVRGHLLRKQNVDKLRQMQALVRAQARARAGRGALSEAPHSSMINPSRFNHTVRIQQEKMAKHEQPIMIKRNGSRSSNNLAYDQEASSLVHHHHWMERRKGEAPWEQAGSFVTRIVRVDDEQSDKVLEVDTGRPNMVAPLTRNILHSSQPSHASDRYCPTYALSKEIASASHQTAWIGPSLGGVQSLSPLALALDASGSPFYTAANSLAYYSASSMDGSSRQAPFTPGKSYLSGSSDHPSYMAYTESSKAKARSLSAPKQRPEWERSTCSQWERSNSVNRYSARRDGTSSQRLNSSFSTSVYPGSGRSDKIGMPARDVSEFSGGLWRRY